MPNFVMAPGVRVYVATSRHGIVDISDDVAEGSLTRRSDGVSSFAFSLQNPLRKYDGVFSPNDRIVVQMKRIKWVQVFTGYLNRVPLVTAWPRVVHLTASCSLKRLQYWYWDSHAEYTQAMIRQALGDAADTGTSDGGITNVALTILKKVVGWPESKVHIAAIPGNWYKVIEDLAKQIDARLDKADELVRQMMEQLGGAWIDGFGGTASTSSLTGDYGNYGSKDQKKNAAIIYNVGVAMGASKRDIIIAIMTAMQESALRNIDYGDRDSLGLFQQRPSQGWGTRDQILNPEYAARKFYEGLLKLANRGSLRLTEAAQAVQRSAFPEAYAKHEKIATKIVNDLAKGAQRDLTSRPQGTATGSKLAQFSVDYCGKYPNIPYRMIPINEQQLMKEPPPYLDCSSFVQAMYARVLGGLHGLPRVAADQYQACKKISVEQALKTPGALVFRGPTPAGIDHVEMSLGDGKSTIGAHSSTAKPHQVGVNPPSPKTYWSYGGLLPRIEYQTDSGTVIFDGADGSGEGGAEEQDREAIRLVTGADAPGYNPDDPFDRMFGDNAWLPVSSAENDPNYWIAQALTGPRALLNDQPLLPYLKNLFNATMRSFCSAPNGDLIAWYPDYYGMWGTAAKMVVEPIEVEDFEVSWSDDYMVTHQYVVTSPMGTNLFDPKDGSVASTVSQSALTQLAVQTTGVVTIDFPGVWKALFGMDLSEKDAKRYSDTLKRRFGARPDYQQIPGLIGPKAQLFSAIFLFMRQFAYQYSAHVPLTWMPELWPGMLIQVPKFNFQAYVTTVTHTFQFGEGGGFSTQVQVVAPARLNADSPMLLGLPTVGQGA